MLRIFLLTILASQAVKYDYFPQKQNFNVLMVESFLIVQVLALFVTDLNPKLVLILFVGTFSLKNKSQKI